mmetsp:Transcript_111097/g.346206  ORF Transcript_111097/g.346206 Transcript_111097/m.346206 type:complete len:281 (+) Transcript_111097:137-979(+)
MHACAPAWRSLHGAPVTLARNRCAVRTPHTAREPCPRPPRRRPAARAVLGDARASILERQEGSDAGADPDGRILPRRQDHVTHEVRAVACGREGALPAQHLVDWARVHPSSALPIKLGLKEHHWYRHEELLGPRGRERVELIVPAATLEEEAVHVATGGGVLGEVAAVGPAIVADVHVKVDAVDGILVPPREVLHHRREKGLGKEEAGDPEADGMPLVEPGVEEADAVVQVLIPRGQRLQREESDTRPAVRDQVHEQTLADILQFLRHHDKALDGSPEER